MGLLNNTMVVLISDHGMYIGEHRRTGKHTVDKGDPWPIYEEVAHIPLLVWIPKGNLPKRVDALAQPADLMATILDLCDVKKPQIYGNSWLPLLEGKARQNSEYIFTSCHSWEGPGRIDYLPSLITVTGHRWLLIVGPDPFWAELYDLWADPHQNRNVIRHHSEVAKGMLKALRDFMLQQGAPQEYVKAYTSI